MPNQRAPFRRRRLGEVPRVAPGALGDAEQRAARPELKDGSQRARDARDEKRRLLLRRRERLGALGRRHTSVAGRFGFGFGFFRGAGRVCLRQRLGGPVEKSRQRPGHVWPGQQARQQRRRALAHDPRVGEVPVLAQAQDTHHHRRRLGVVCVSRERIHRHEVERDQHQDGEPEDEHRSRFPRRAQFALLLQRRRAHLRVVRSNQQRDDRLQISGFVWEKLYHRLGTTHGRECVQSLRGALHEDHVRVVAFVRLRAQHAGEGRDPALEVRIEELREFLVAEHDLSDFLERDRICVSFELGDGRDERVHLVLLRHEGHLPLILGGLFPLHRGRGRALRHHRTPPCAVELILKSVNELMMIDAARLANTKFAKMLHHDR